MAPALTKRKPASTPRREFHYSATSKTKPGRIIAAMQIKIDELQNTNGHVLENSAVLEEALKEMRHYNKTISAERDKLLTATENLPKCTCKCGRGGLMASAKPRAKSKSPRDLQASTSCAGGQPVSPRHLDAWMVPARGQPSTSTDLGAPTTSALGHPTPGRQRSTC